MEDDPFPREFVPKANPHYHRERELFGSGDIAEFVQVKFHRSTWFLENPRDEFLESDQKLVINTMENDRYLFERTPEKEFERFQQLDGIADVAFAGDRWTYENLGPREILKEVERSVKGQFATHRMVTEANLDIALYPTIVAWEPWHFERQKVLFEEFDTQSCGFDGTQYNSIRKLVTDLETLVDTLNPDRIYLNGRISRDHLRRVPKEVVAFSGKYSLLTEARLPSGGYSRELLREGIEERVDAMHSWQTELSDFYPVGVTGD